ncbi:MAG: hypothetical protein QXF40_02950 [Metallosphaera sp.]
MSVDVDSKLNFPQSMVEGSGEALAHIVAAASILKSMNELTLDSVEIVRKYVDNWIMSVVPLDYVPGMAEFLGGKLRRSILDVLDEISEEELGQTLEMIPPIKRSIDEGDVPLDFAEAEVRMERVLRSLGLEVNELGRFLENLAILEKMKRLITLFVLAIGISSVRDRLWIVESQ